MRHLARYAATQTGLLRVLDRKITRWATATHPEPEAAQAARATARAIVARLAESGAVNDAEFAQSRTRSLSRAGKSSRAIGAHLAARGVPSQLTQTQTNPNTELAAAAIHIRKRRLGPFSTKPTSPEQHRRELASLARAGFSSQTATTALRLSREEAETLIISFRADL
jgi:regulatory protein